MSADEMHRKILVVDDNRAVHDSFRKILAGTSPSSPLSRQEIARLSELEAEILGAEPAAAGDEYTVHSAYQGPEAVDMVKRAVEAGARYSLAFVDMRMPPSWDGVQTIEKIWEVDDQIQTVICTAYSDYSWRDLQKRLGATDRLLLLKKPFDVIEVQQLALALTTKWRTESARFALMRDLSERKEVEKLKDEFVSTVSHELRTPLTSICGGLRLLEEGVVGRLNEESLEIVRIARLNADRLTRLINDILDLEKLEAGKLKLEIRPIEIPRLVETTLYEVHPIAANASVELRSSAVVPGIMQGDEDRLVQVLKNLVSNAIKFSPRDGVVDIHVDAAPGDRVRFSVIDQGTGIATEDVSKLFGKFQQLDSSDSRSKGGTGLGLSIAKGIIQQHGGEIGLLSRVGHGSTFWFELPRSPAPPSRWA